MPFFDLSQQPTREIFPGVTITTAWGEEIMLSFVHFDRADALVPTHQHPHEQAGMGMEGEFELIIGDEARIIRKGDSYCIPGNTPHSARSVNGPARALDIFHPVRDDYK
ncbi:MAG: Cupin domain protein [Armatimonadetes bacterium]|jgi:quercetin dioxygenase-like cupin family protein|nr:Cupin domain protein [Armatimonadota bacterium]